MQVDNRQLSCTGVLVKCEVCDVTVSRKWCLKLHTEVVHTMTQLFLQGPSLSEIECSLAGLNIEEVEKVLSVVQRDLEERQFVVNETNLEKKDSMKEVRLTNISIVPNLYDELSDFGSYDTDYEDHDNSPVVNLDGRYEKFDDISLYDDEEFPDRESVSDKSDISSDQIQAFLNEMSEDERSQIVDVRKVTKV